MPGIWFQVGLSLGDRTARGASMAGLPGIYMGQNNDLVWTFTNVMADVQDLFIERIDGERYLFEGEWLPLEIDREEIEVKGRSTPEVLEIRRTHHGPIVNEPLGADHGEPLALRWISLDEPTVTASNLTVLNTTSGPELVDQLRAHTTPVSNLVWADRHGSIGYKLVGRLPIRRGGCPDLPKPGWTGEYEWEGTVPYDELPELTDPKSGYLVTANNRIVGDDYPHHITSEYLSGYRARRIEDLLKSSDEHDADGFERMQSDLHSIPGAGDGAPARPPGARRPSARSGRSSGCAAGTARWPPARSRRRSTRPSPCAWRASSPARRSATATSPSATWTVPTTASRRM